MTALTAVTPKAGLVSVVATGGTPVVVAAPLINGCYITNPQDATEPLFVDPVAPAATVEGGTTIALAPGQTYNAVPGQTNSLTVNAATSGHVFSCVRW